MVDARLHIHMRPTAEYLIPEVGRLIVGALLGDSVPDEVDEALSSLETAAFLSEEEAVVCPTGELLSRLRHLCLAVCTHLTDYLHSLAHRWTAHVTLVRQTVRKEMRRFDEEFEAARRVRDGYRARNPVAVDREYKQELQRLSQRLDATLETIRAQLSPPDIHRPDALVGATEALKAAYVDAIPNLSTDVLLHMKNYIDHEFACAQCDVARTFHAKMRRLCANA